MNNIIEQDHRHIKRIVKPMLGFQSFSTARRTLQGIEAIVMIRKEQVKGINQGDSVSQAKFIEALEHVKRRLKIFCILSERYRNRCRYFGLRFKLIAMILNSELAKPL